MTSGERHSSKVDSIANAWAETRIRLDPVLGTRVGRPHAGLPDFSPTGYAELALEAAHVRQELLQVDARGLDAHVTVRELERETTQILDEHEAGLLAGELNVIASPTQQIRDSFDLMPKSTEHDWALIDARLGEVRTALAGYRESLAERTRCGPPLAHRQLLAVADQAERIARGHFTRQFGPAPVSSQLSAALAHHAADAEAAYAEFGQFLRDELLPYAVEADDVGAHHYSIMSRRFLGTAIDTAEYHDWGLELLADLTQQLRRLARRIVGSDSIQEAIAALDHDPARRVHGVDALQAWLQGVSDAAVTELSGTHFEIPQNLHRLECRIAPSQDGGIYYTEPDLKGQRPGRMWWSVPPGITEFRTWREKTTVYHEGVPGHHLQMGGAALAGSTVNLWRRSIAGTSGHREGWALYAEQLMRQLGFLDDPGELLGMLDAQRMRAARLVLDIGLHTGRSRPDGDRWTAEYAFDFMRANTVMSDPSLRYEVLRYLGWPGQAASYCIGQRVWEELRAQSERQYAEARRPHDLRAFHTRSLSLGGVGLDTLRWATSQSGLEATPWEN